MCWFSESESRGVHSSSSESSKNFPFAICTPFHINDEIMAAVQDHIKERLAVREREQQKLAEEAGEDSSEDEIAAKPAGCKARRSGIHIEETPTKKPKATPKTPKHEKFTSRDESVKSEHVVEQYEVPPGYVKTASGIFKGLATKGLWKIPPGFAQISVAVGLMSDSVGKQLC
jgi:hypothetical protein